MWRDPLDELIEDLERALPNSSPGVDATMSLEDLQHYVSTALYGTEEARANEKREPWFDRVEKYFAEMAERQQREWSSKTNTTGE